MKIFLISTVRLGEDVRASKYVEYMEKLGHEIHYPIRDTNQIDPTGGWDICKQNMRAIQYCDEVHIFYNPASQGTHFDLGMAFVLGKKIKLINDREYEELKNQDKSFLKMIEYWEKHG